MGTLLQLSRLALLGLSGLGIQQGLALSFDGEPNGAMTYAAFYGVGGVALLAVAAVSVVIARRAPAKAEEAVKSTAALLLPELDTIDGIARNALETGHWWDNNATGLGHQEWDQRKDAIAITPLLARTVADAYERAEALNRSLSEVSDHGKHPRPPIDSEARRKLEELRTQISTARIELGAYCGIAAGPSPPAIRHTLDEDASLRVTLRKGLPQTVLWEPGVQNPNRGNLEGLSVNLLLSEGIRVEKCDRDGVPSDKGMWTTTDERWDEQDPDSAKEYWAAGGRSISGTGYLLFPIKLRIRHPGTYFIKTKVYGGGLPSAAIRTQRIEVVEAEETDLRDRAAELITVAEAATSGPDSTFGDGDEHAHHAWILDTAMMEAELPDRHREWLKKKLDAVNVPGSGAEWQVNHAQASLPFLYELRRRLARNSD